MNSKELVTVWILVFPKAPMLERVSQCGAGESHGTFKRWGLVEAHRRMGVCLWRRGELSTLPLFFFAIEVKLCLAKFSYHGALHHMALKEVVLPSHGPEPPELSHNTLILSVSWLSQVFATVTEGWLNISLYKYRLWALLIDGHSYWKSY